MKLQFSLLPIIASFFVGLVVASHAGLSPEEYWKKLLPNTPMPKAIQESLKSDGSDTSVNVGGNGVELSVGKPGEGTQVNVGTGGVDVHTGKPGKGADVHVGNNGVDVNTGKPGKGAHVNVGTGGVDVNAGKPGKGADVHVGNNGVDVNAGKPGKGADVHVGDGVVDVNAGKPGKGADVRVGNGGVDVHAGKGAANVHVGGGVDVSAVKPVKGADVHVGGGGVDVKAGANGKGGADVHVGPGGVSVHVGGKGKHGVSPFDYNYAASETQLRDDPNVALFFLEKNLKPGTQMNLHFTKTTNGATFLPRDVADSIPFSSDKIHDILARFDLAPGSQEAEVIQQTVKECEEKGIMGEEKYCATSLEAMLDFTASKLGREVAAVSTHAEKETPMQKYFFTGVKAVPSPDSVVCHKQNYAYAVFYCHKTMATKTYMVSLVGEDGAKVKAAAVCHTDTSKWNPKHLAFQVLKVEPGSVPICHFLPEDHIVWVRS